MKTTPATYIATDSAQFATGTAGYISDATARRAWFSLRADGSDGCYVFPHDVADASQMDRARECLNERCGDEDYTDETLYAEAREIVAIDIAADEADL